MPAEEKGRETIVLFIKKFTLCFILVKKQPLKTKYLIQKLSPNWSVLPGGKPQSYSLAEALTFSGNAPLSRYCCACTPLKPACLDNNGKEEHRRTRLQLPLRCHF